MEREREGEGSCVVEGKEMWGWIGTRQERAGGWDEGMRGMADGRLEHA